MSAPHYGAKRERTLAVTWGPWGGFYANGKRGLIWRVCLGFVAITYIPAEMTQILGGWLDSEDYEKTLRYMADYRLTGTEQTLHIDFQGKAREALRDARSARPEGAS